jgi:sulfoxide reductase heme-binding subunit YedZ
MEVTHPSPTRWRWAAAKTAAWIAALAPLGLLVWRALTGGLGANPIEAVIHQTGWWTLALLTVTLAISPLRRLSGWNAIIRFRRLIGLFTFFYATLHMLSYVAIDQFFAFEFILEDIAERPFITAGFAGWLILLALAATSTRRWIQRLGRNWQRLHRLVYLAAGLGVLHFFWRVKADTLEPLIFAAVIGLLLVVRLFGRRPPKRAMQLPSPGPAS